MGGRGEAGRFFVDYLTSLSGDLVQCAPEEVNAEQEQREDCPVFSSVSFTILKAVSLHGGGGLFANGIVFGAKSMA